MAQARAPYPQPAVSSGRLIYSLRLSLTPACWVRELWAPRDPGEEPGPARSAPSRPGRLALFPLRNSASETPINGGWRGGAQQAGTPTQVGSKKVVSPEFDTCALQRSGVRKSEGREWKKLAQPRACRDCGEWKRSYKWEPLGSLQLPRPGEAGTVLLWVCRSGRGHQGAWGTAATPEKGVEGC